MFSHKDTKPQRERERERETSWKIPFFVIFVATGEPRLRRVALCVKISLPLESVSSVNPVDKINHERSLSYVIFSGLICSLVKKDPYKV